MCTTFVITAITQHITWLYRHQEVQNKNLVLLNELIKPNFCFDLFHRRSTTVSLETRNSSRGSVSFLDAAHCGTESEHQVPLMAASLDCFPSSSCLLLREYWNLVPNNNNILVKQTKIWLPFKIWC